ncbi:MAG: protein translocase subunit SecD [Actinomycetota bacterium]
MSRTLPAKASDALYSSKRLGWSLALLLLILIGATSANIASDNTPALGLDLQGGVAVTQEPVGEYSSESLDVAVERIRDRVDSLGVAEPEIIRQGDAIVVNLPGIENQEEAIRLVQVTGEVLLRPVLTAAPLAPTDPESSSTSSTSSTASTTPTDSTTSESSTTAPGGPSRPVNRVTGTQPPTSTAESTSTSVSPPTETAVDTATSVPADGSASSVPVDQTGDPNDPAAIVIVQSVDGSEIYQLGPSFATGEVFADDATADIIQGSWGVRVSLRSGAEGSDLWNIGAAQCFSRTQICPTGRMAIVLDGVVQSAPSVNQPSFTGGVDITGNFQESEARELARVLKSGALPVRLAVQAVQTVSPTLGGDSLDAAILAGLVGVGLVLLFMILYYRLIALIVAVGIVVAGLVQWNVISLLSQTNGLALSLAGIAGIVVSVGITIDSYVVVFEKLKDNLRTGRTLQSASDRSFAAAWKTIVTADVASLIGALTLWYLTVGAVRGFAFFLALSTLIDLIVAWFFLRPALVLFSRSRIARGRTFLGVKTPKDDSELIGQGAS